MDSDEIERLRQRLRENIRVDKPRIARLVGAVLGGIVPHVDLSKLTGGEDDPLTREFVEGFEEGKITRLLGDLMMGAVRKPKKEEEP